METKEKVSIQKAICKHCGGIMRYYRGSVTCLMCGRDTGHMCRSCSNASGPLQKTA